MREKLIEILETVVSPKELLCDGEVVVSTARVADHLIANGVTLAEDNNVPSKWIPVTERLPENDYGKHWKERKYYLVRLAPSGLLCVAHYGYKEHGWWIDGHDCVLSATHFKEVTHWMEIENLPQPPKGE
jgi:hypothetical protein